MYERRSVLESPGYGIVDGQGTLMCQPGPERLARHVGHDVERPLTVNGRDEPGLDEPEDMRVLQAGRQPDFGQKARGAERGCGFRANDLDGDLPRVPNVVREVDGRHPAFAELALDVVAAREAAPEQVVGLGHALTLRPSH